MPSSATNESHSDANDEDDSSRMLGLIPEAKIRKLPIELQENIVGFIAEHDAIIVHQSPQRVTFPDPRQFLGDNQHLLGIWRREFFKVNTFRIGTTGVGVLDDEPDLRPHIRHIEYIVSTRDLITLWRLYYHQIALIGTAPKPTIDQLTVLGDLPGLYPELETVTVKLVVVVNLKRLQEMDANVRSWVTVLRRDIATSVLQTIMNMQLPRSSKGEVKKYLHADLSHRWSSEQLRAPFFSSKSTEIDGRGKSVVDLYSRMLGLRSIIVRL